MKNWTHKSVLKLIEESNNPNPEQEIRDRARSLVLTALENGWSGPPFNALELSKYLGYEIIPNDGVIDARTIPFGKKSFQIEYNPFQRPTRMNFSIAHEIAHTLFPDCAEKIRNREESPSLEAELEQLCNIGAAEIQLPYAIFSNDANSIDVITLEHLIALATKYKSSLESLFLRFVEVIDKPCAIMICSFHSDDDLVVEYSKASNFFSTKIPRDFKIPQGSAAYDCTSPGWSSREKIKWNVLDASYEIHCIGLTPLRKDNKGRVGIIITENKTLNEEDGRKINLEFGDATKPRGGGIKIIAQVINTSGALGIGFGKSLAKNYPITKSMLKSWYEDKNRFRLGNSQLVKVDDGLYVFQMLAQKGLFEKNGEIPLKYSHLRTCLIQLYYEALNLDASIHMPMIGAGQARGNWDVIQGMIHDEIVSKGINVAVYMLPGKNPSIKNKSTLTLFDEKTTWHKEK